MVSVKKYKVEKQNSEQIKDGRDYNSDRISDRAGGAEIIICII